MGIPKFDFKVVNYISSQGFEVKELEMDSENEE
jgi:hypothetical protein